MSISLQKGQKISLTKDNPSIKTITAGLGWDEVSTSKGGFFSKKPAPIDCDASVILLKDDKFKGKDDIIYFGNLKHKSGAVVHTGDNLTGEGDGDDEQINIDLSLIPSDCNKVIFVVNIYDCVARKQHFGLIENAFIRLINNSNNSEICKYNLSDDYTNKTAVIAAEIYRHNDEWKFSAIGEGTFDTGLNDMLKRYM